ncbi:MAG: cation:proton antiporter [Fibrobacterota bacterium]|nr:cation:proton antiporter [Fibrobacterota bacterium]QQS03077.1 MAG: cation:proton antiporter [Fibrobacterota bacterium]
MDPISSLALLSAAFLVAAMLHRFVSRWGVPGILLELAIGFAVGNWIASPHQVGSILGAAELGVLVLFGLVGLETNLGGLLPMRWTVLKVAGLSITVSALGFGLIHGFFRLAEGEPLIVAATIMTSGTGMAMRVLREHKLVGTPSGRVLLGASVLDDFPAILLLSIALASSRTTRMDLDLGWIRPMDFLAAAVLLGMLLLIRFRKKVHIRPVHAIPLLVLGAWSSHHLGLTSLLGALLVGMALQGDNAEDTERFLSPYALFLIPVYFITVGMRVPLEALLDSRSWWLGGGLFGLALCGRLICSLGIGRDAREKGVDSWIIIWGMIPRGLPGLVFATVAREAGLLSATTFFGLVLMVTLTNLVGLAGLSWRAQQLGQKIFSAG